MIAERLLATLNQRGLSIRRGDEPGQLILSGPNEERTEDIMTALREFKPELLEYFDRPQDERQEPHPLADSEPEPIVCPQCKGTFHAPEEEIRSFMQSPHFCDKPKCPFR